MPMIMIKILHTLPRVGRSTGPGRGKINGVVMFPTAADHQLPFLERWDEDRQSDYYWYEHSSDEEDSLIQAAVSTFESRVIGPMA
jgi:hypothetical protein